MNRNHTSLSLGVAVLLFTLSGCGGDGSQRTALDKNPEQNGEAVFQVTTEAGTVESFPRYNTNVTQSGSLTLETCSEDPTPYIADDEIYLCLRVDLDPAALSTVQAPATLSIHGEAQKATPTNSDPAPFTPASGHAPVVSTAWASIGCFSHMSTTPLQQQIVGRLELEHNTAQRIAGRFVLSTQGEMRAADCGKFTVADFDFRFDVARP